MLSSHSFARRLGTIWLVGGSFVETDFGRASTGVGLPANHRHRPLNDQTVILFSKRHTTSTYGKYVSRPSPPSPLLPPPPPSTSTASPSRFPIARKFARNTCRLRFSPHIRRLHFRNSIGNSSSGTGRIHDPPSRSVQEIIHIIIGGLRGLCSFYFDEVLVLFTHSSRTCRGLMFSQKIENWHGTKNTH